jgi:hypothetical protein
MKNHHTIWLSILLAMGLALAPEVCPAQDLVFKLSGRLGEDIAMGDHRFGFQANALTGVDPLDTPEPPLPPGSYISLAFIMEDPQFPLHSRWRDNFHSPVDWVDFIETWEMVFSTDQSEEDCVVTLEMITGNANDIQVRVIKPNSSLDLGTGGEFTVTAGEMGAILLLEIRGGQNLVSSISFDGLRSLYR